MSGGRFKGAPDLCLGREPVRVTSPGKLLRGIRHVMGRRSPVLFGQGNDAPVRHRRNRFQGGISQDRGLHGRAVCVPGGQPQSGERDAVSGLTGCLHRGVLPPQCVLYMVSAYGKCTFASVRKTGSCLFHFLLKAEKQIVFRWDISSSITCLMWVLVF